MKIAQLRVLFWLSLAAGYIQAAQAEEYDVDCMTTKRGELYRGTISKTETGKECQRWDKRSPHRHGIIIPGLLNAKTMEEAHNYCRNPPNFEETPYCFTTDPDTRFEKCDIPRCKTLRPEIDCITTRRGYEYKGTLSTTASGKTCQAWNSQEPHEQHMKADHLGVSNLDEVKNYCRNSRFYRPGKRPWCYTTDPERRFDYCEIPRCAKSGEKQKCQPPVNTRVVGTNRFYFNSGETIRVECYYGYKMVSGATRLTCDKYGDWRQKVPDCVEKEAHKAQANKDHKAQAQAYSSNMKIQQSSEESSDNDEEKTEVCEDHDPQCGDVYTSAWCEGDDMEVAESAKQLCPLLCGVCSADDSPPTGKQCSLPSGLKALNSEDKTKFDAGVSIKIKCEGGLKVISGDELLKCGQDGEWLDDIPECDVECEVEHCKKCVSGDGHKCQRNQCDVGYYRTAESKCEESNERCKVPTGTLPTTSNNFEFKPGEVIQLKCDVGLKLVKPGDKKLTCNTLGDWIGKIPTCEEACEDLDKTCGKAGKLSDARVCKVDNIMGKHMRKKCPRTCGLCD